MGSTAGSLAVSLAVSLAAVSGCVPPNGAGTTDPSTSDPDTVTARVTRDNAALRRRVQMLEDRVLHLEQNGGDTPRGQTAAVTTPDGRSLPVVRLQADHAPDPSVTSRTWRSETAPGAAHGEPAAVDPAVLADRRSRTIGTQPSPLEVDPTQDAGGFVGADDEEIDQSARSFRLMGSHLAELSKNERKPAAVPVAAPAGRQSKRHGAQEHRAAPASSAGVVARYEQAMAMLKAGRADAAFDAFDALVREHPRHDYADNALYWKGEAAYDQRHFADALAAFTQVVEQYGGGNKAPDALLKIGLCYDNLGDAANARDVMTALIAAYPGARATSIARVKLAELPLAPEEGM